MPCKYTLSCIDCLFNSKCNATGRKKWLEEEYEEHISLSATEIILLKALPKDYKWIARDPSGCLYVFTEKPWRNNTLWDGIYFEDIRLFNDFFRFIKWEDEELYNIDELLEQNGETREYYQEISDP